MDLQSQFITELCSILINYKVSLVFIFYYSILLYNTEPCTIGKKSGLALKELAIHYQHRSPQISGTPMGSPLSSFLAEVIMQESRKEICY